MQPSIAADEEVEKITVTGSRIKRTDIENASPIVTITQEDIHVQGYTSVQDVLDGLSQNSNGSLTQQSIHGFTPAASGVNLRGAGLGRVLTLIDGKRLPKYPQAAGGTTNFVDTANIPLEAIERIEVLTTGGSAIYGSDAMGGVINIIMKDDFEGVSVTARNSDTSNEGREINSVALTIGNATDKSHTIFTIGYEDREALVASQRAGMEIDTDLAFDSIFSSYSSYGASLRNTNGSTVLATLTPEECEARGFQYWDYGNSTVGGVCGFDRTSMRDLLPEQSRLSGMFKFGYELADNHDLYGRMLFTRSETTTNIESMPLNDWNFDVANGMVTVTADQDPNLTATLDQATSFGGDFADLADGSGYRYTRRALEFGNRRNLNENTMFGFMLGARGELTDTLDYDVSWNFARIETEDWGTGYASAGSFFQWLVSDNGQSLLDRISADDVASMRYDTFGIANSTISNLSAGVSGFLMEMPAGDLEFAAGIESSREWFVNSSDSESMKGNILTTGGSSGEGAREFDAIYAEFLVPVMEDMKLSLAGRYDDYSDAGGKFTPMAQLEYRPLDNLLLRALWAETFRAPDMQRVYGDITVGFSQVTDPQGCTDNGGTVGDPNSPISACNGEHYIQVNTGPNADLEPEQGTNLNLGVVYSLDDFNISVDYWKVEIEDIVNNLGAQSILNNPDAYGHLITRDSNGFATLVNATAQNLSFFESSGIDLATSYSIDTGIGKFGAGLELSYNLSNESRFSPESEVFDNLTQTNVPDYRANLRLNYGIEDFSTTFFVRHISSMKGTNVSQFSEEDLDFLGDTIPSHTRVNWTGSYNVSTNMALTVGVNNIFDQGPHEDTTNWGWPHYPREYYDAVGREYFISVQYSL